MKNQVRYFLPSLLSCSTFTSGMLFFTMRHPYGQLPSFGAILIIGEGIIIFIWGPKLLVSFLLAAWSTSFSWISRRRTPAPCSFSIAAMKLAREIFSPFTTTTGFSCERSITALAKVCSVTSMESTVPAGASLAATLRRCGCLGTLRAWLRKAMSGLS